MKITIAATKTNLIRAKKNLTLTREGYELLDEKRRILLLELNTVVHTAEKLERDVDAALREGYQLVDKAMIIMGRKRLEEISFSVDIKSDLSITQRRIMGVVIPGIELRLQENPPYFSPYKASLYVDEVIVKFKDILKALAKLAERKIALLRLAKEVQETIRKVNALEKVYLPLYQETIKYIGDRLDEEARDAFSMLKLIKARLRE